MLRLETVGPYSKNLSSVVVEACQGRGYDDVAEIGHWSQLQEETHIIENVLAVNRNALAVNRDLGEL